MLWALPEYKVLARNSSTSQNLHGDAAEVTCKGKEQVISPLPPPSCSTRQLRLATSSGRSEKSYLSLLMLLGKMPSATFRGQENKTEVLHFLNLHPGRWLILCRMTVDFFGWMWFGACYSPCLLKLSKYTWNTYSAWGYCSGSMSMCQCSHWG